MITLERFNQLTKALKDQAYYLLNQKAKE
jgi:hypothetical protein